MLPPSSEKIIENVEYLFPNWLENDKDNDADPEDYAKAGTKKRRRRYVKKVREMTKIRSVKSMFELSTLIPLVITESKRIQSM